MHRLLGTLAIGLVLVAGAAAEPRPQPDVLRPEPTAQWRQEGKARSDAAVALTFLEEGVTIAALAWLAFSGAATRLRERVVVRFRRRAAGTAVYLAIVLAGLAALALPFDAARFALSRSYGVAQQSAGSWLGDHAVASGLSLAFGVGLGLGFYALLRRRPATWWRWVTAAAVPFSLAVVAASPLYISLFNTFSPLTNRPLAEKILALAARADVPAHEVYEIDLSRQSRAANAFVTGIGPTTTIALGDTLLDNFRDDEILFVMAHEMGHYVHKHLWIGLAAAALLTAAGAFLLQRLLDAVLGRYHGRLGYAELSDVASAPLVLLAIAVLSFFGEPIGNTISRALEADADRFAVQLTVPTDVSPDAAVSAFERLGRLALSDPNPNPVIEFMLWSHPSLDERIAAVRRSSR